MDLVIATEAGRSSSLAESLRREFHILRGKGIRVTVWVIPPGRFRCRLQERRLFGKRNSADFRRAVANAAAALILAEWETLIGGELVKQINWFDTQDWELVRGRLETDRGCLRRFRPEIERRVAAHLEQSKMLIIEGFVRFRLRDIVEEVGAMAGRLLDDHLLQQENRDFIRMLRSYARSKGVQNTVIHIIFSPSRIFRIYDERMCLLATNAEGAGMPVDDEVNHEDLLIASVIGLAPRRIVIHGQQCLPATLQTLRDVFGEGVDVCPGCNLCSIWQQA